MSEPYADVVAERDALRVKVEAVRALIPLDGSVYVVTTDQLDRALGAEPGDFVIIPVNRLGHPHLRPDE